MKESAISMTSGAIRARLSLCQVLKEQPFIPIFLNLALELRQLVFILLNLLSVQFLGFFEGLHLALNVLHYLLISKIAYHIELLHRPYPFTGFFKSFHSDLSNFIKLSIGFFSKLDEISRSFIQVISETNFLSL